MSALIIAEAGVNHNGDPELARQLIDIAAEAGADWVKFQTFSADRLVTTEAKKAQYQARSTDAHESQHAMLRALELTRSLRTVSCAALDFSPPHSTRKARTCLWSSGSHGSRSRPVKSPTCRICGI